MRCFILNFAFAGKSENNNDALIVKLKACDAEIEVNARLASPKERHGTLQIAFETILNEARAIK